MSVLDDWRDLSSGHVRVETGPHTPEERQKLKQGSVLIVVGFTVLGLSQDWVVTTFAMMIGGVFVRILWP